MSWDFAPIFPHDGLSWWCHVFVKCSFLCNIITIQHFGATPICQVPVLRMGVMAKTNIFVLADLMTCALNLRSLIQSAFTHCSVSFYVAFKVMASSFWLVFQPMSSYFTQWFSITNLFLGLRGPFCNKRQNSFTYWIYMLTYNCLNRWTCNF